MKVEIIRKFKWYIVGFIMIVIMLSVGLSFCTWDDLSIKSVSANGKTGNYYNERLYKLADDKYADDNFAPGANGVANIGDVVAFGRYYQNAPTVNGSGTVLPEKTSLRWIIVHKENEILTLLAESVVAFGSFWGTWCYDANNDGAWGNTTAAYQTHYQNYEQSTVRAWLNSNYTLRNDGGTAFADNESGVFKGFLNEAFNTEERAYIQEKTISGIYGSQKAANNNTVNLTYCEIYDTSVDKVWLPSYSELYGNTTKDWNNKNDGNPNYKFSYFNDDNDVINNTRRVGKTTAFASSNASNYTYKGKIIGTQNWQFTSKDSAAWWWLRSPSPPYWGDALAVNAGGTNGYGTVRHSYGGIRPAVCVPL